MRIPAPAKINLGLRVFRARRGHLHRLESLMVPLHWGDDLELRPLTRGIVRLCCRAAGLPPPADNLAVRAAEAVREAFGIREGVEIRLRKCIPLGAGLGGGSSDAAAVVKGMARLWRLPRGPRLRAVAASLGSDVPFFLAGGPAWVAGTGDRVTPFRGLPPWWTVLVTFPFGVSTAWAYQAFDRAYPASLTPGRPFIKMLRESLTGAGRRHERRGLRGVNDLEAVVTARYPLLRTWLSRLERHAPVLYGLSGSGSTLYAVERTEAEARRLARALRREGSGAVRVTPWMRGAGR